MGDITTLAYTPDADLDPGCYMTYLRFMNIVGQGNVNGAEYYAVYAKETIDYFNIASNPIDGDADLDCDVDLKDFVILKTHFGTGQGWEEGDFDEDGDVDLDDFVILKQNFGATITD